MKNRRFSRIFGLAAMSFVLFTSCEIGLGSAVDTEPPALEITNPPVDSIVRGDFAVKGSWTDDGSIGSVKVTLNRTDGKGTAISSDAKVSGSDGKGKWSAVFDPAVTTILDGSYEALIEITDTAGHKTTQTRTFGIDNTAPFIVLQRPGTKITETPDAYGQTFTLNGMGADDNSIDHIDINIYSDEECNNLLKTITKSNVPPTIELQVAVFEDGIQNDYATIYGSASKNGTQTRYCKIIAYDNAKHYPPEGDATEADDKGNSTTDYYLYDDIYDSILDHYTVTDVYKMLSGTYLLADSNRSADTVTSVKAQLNDFKIAKSNFSLNPENNPQFFVNGRDPLTGNAADFAGNEYNISSGTSVVIEVATGLDGIPLEAATLRPYLLPCNALGSPAVEDVADNRIYLADAGSGSKSGTSYKFTVNFDHTTAYPGNKFITIGGTYIVRVEGHDKNQNSIIPKGNAYGFKLTSNGAAPGLTITNPSTPTAYVGANGNIQITGIVTCQDGLPTVTIKNGTNTPIYNYTFTSGDSTTLNGVKQFNFNHTINYVGVSENSQIQYTIEASLGDLKTTAYKTIIYDKDAPVIDGANILPVATRYFTNPQDSVYSNGNTYNEGNPYTESDYLNGTVTLRLTINDEYDAVDTTTENKKPYFEVIEVADDNTESVLSLQLGADSDVVAESAATQKHYITKLINGSFNLDTTQIQSGTGEKKIKFKAYAWDKAGNDAVYTYPAPNATNSNPVFKVNQETDKPVILPASNDLSLKYATKNDRDEAQTRRSQIPSGGQLLLTLLDDDGIEKYKLLNLTLASDGELKAGARSRFPSSANNYEAVFNGSGEVSGNESTQIPVSEFVSNNAGYYWYMIWVKDKNGNITETGPFIIKVTTAAPSLLSVSIEESDSSDAAVGKYVGGTGSAKTKWKNKIEIDSSEGPFYIYRKEGSDFAEGDYPDTKPDSPATGDYTVGGDVKSRLIWAGANASSTTQYDIIESPDANKTYYYIVLDNNWNNSNSRSITREVDRTIPSTLTIDKPGETTATNPTPYISGTSDVFTGEARDADAPAASEVKSGISKLYYKITNSNTSPAAAAYESQTITDGRWNINVNMGSSASELAEGTYWLHMKTEDAAGNQNDIAARKFFVDQSVPTLLIPSVNEYYKKDDIASVTFTAEDTNKMSAISVSIKKNGEDLDPSDNPTVYADNGITLNINTAPTTTADGKSRLTATLSFTTNGNHDGIYEVTAEATDIAGRKSQQVKFTTTIDGTKPEIGNSFKVGTADYSSTAYYKDSTLKFSGTFSDATSGMDTLYYYVLDSEATGTGPTELTASNAHGDMSFRTSTTSSYDFNFTTDKYKNNTYSNGTPKANKVFIQAVDKAGNKSDLTNNIIINVDTTAPDLEAKFYQVGNAEPIAAGGTVYVKTGAVITIYGNYKDEESGVQALSNFMVGTTGITPTITYSTSEITSIYDITGREANPDQGIAAVTPISFDTAITSTNNKAIRSWKAVFNSTDDTSGLFTLTGTNGANNPKNISPFSITMDNTSPNLKNIRLLVDPAHDKDAYKKTVSDTERYYINNANTATTKLTISGLATDNINVASVTIEITGATSTNTGTASEWKFENINLSGVTNTVGDSPDATAIVTVTDVAGNTNSETLYIYFDTTGPVGKHEVDTLSKDLYFRMGNADNDDITSTTAADYGLTWDNYTVEGIQYTGVDTGVGKKYSDGTYGNASTIKIRGNIYDSSVTATNSAGTTTIDSDSGVKMIYYYVFNKPIVLGSYTDMQEVTVEGVASYGFASNDKLRDYVIANATGYFAPSASTEVKRVFYNDNGTNPFNGEALTGTSKYFKKVETNYDSTISGFTNENKYLVIAAVDNVGNPGLDFAHVESGDNPGDKNYCTINLDTTPPDITLASGEESIRYANGRSEVVISGRVTDLDESGNPMAGVKSISFKVNGHDITTKVENASSEAAANAQYGYFTLDTTSSGCSETDAAWTLTIKPAALQNNGTPVTGNLSVNCTAVDQAGDGNSQILSIATIVMDSTGPTIVVNNLPDADTSTAGNQINGVISISGTASDTNGLSTTETMKLYYTTYQTLGTATAAPASTDFETGTVTSASANSKWVQISTADIGNSWSFTNLNTAKLDGTNTITDNTTVYFMVTAIDKAGNTGYSDRIKAIVDQDTDRPVIKYQNLKLDTEDDDVPYMSASKTLPFATNALYGSVSDDDGVLSLAYQYAESDTDLSATGWTTLNLTNGTFTLNFPQDGTKKIYFKVVDTGVTESSPTGSTFTSAAANAYSLSTPKLTDSATTPNKYGYRGNPTGSLKTVTYLTVDTTAPVAEAVQFSTNYTDATASSATWTSKSEINNMPFGGLNERQTFRIRIQAWDANGIKTVSMTLTGSDDADTTNETITFTNSNVIAGNTINPAATWWISEEIDVSRPMVSGNKNCVITVTDNGSKTSKDDFIIAVDNTNPVITASNPSSSQYSSGNVIAYGETDLTHWKNTSTTDTPTEYMYYALSLDDTTAPAENHAATASASAAAIASWKDENGNPSSLVNNEDGTAKTYKPYYTQILGGSFNWYVYFDGSASTASETHDATFRNFLVNSGVTTQALLDTTNHDLKFRTKVKAYLWIKAVDQVGNTSVIKHPILIDPQGDAPNVSIDYPESSGTTLGGTITLRGSASDTKGTNPGVDSVWVQIISSKDYYDSSAEANHTSGSRTAGGLVFTDTVTASGSGSNITYSHAYELTSFAPKIKDVRQWLTNGYQVYKDITTIDNAATSAVEGPEPVTSIDSSIGDTADGSAYYIKASFSGSAWNLKINEHDEFNPAGGKLNPIAYRVFAKDKDGNLSSYEEQLSVYDSDNPIISNVYLKQFADNTAGTGTVTASRAYEDDIWVRGTWWLCGNVTDTQGLSKLEVGPSSNKTNQNPSGTAGADEEFKYQIGTGSGVGQLKIIIEAADNANVGQNPHTTTKECVINYDNTPPELLGTTAANFNISSTVQNSNGFYTFGSQVTEAPVDNKAQSGFDYLAFWFERNITGKHVVYDVMRPKTQTNGATVVNTSEIAWTDLTDALNESDARGLKWKSKTVTRSQSHLGELTFTGTDANIHVGGLCMLQGSVYMISSVEVSGTETTIGIDGQPEYTASQTAYFAIANVVNNTVEAGSGAKSTVDGMYGYYATMSNDDGDHMLESVSKQGTTWTWEASINSQNIKDGSIVLHYVAFDKAGNFITGQVDGNVANNAPRIASLKVWSDFNENGTEDEGESDTKWVNGKERKLLNSNNTSYYATRATGLTDEFVASGNNKDYDDGGSAFMTVKATTRFVPELVGGNGDLYYTYKYGTAGALSNADLNIGAVSIGTGADDGIDEDIDASGYYVQDQNQAGYINGRTDLYPAGTAAEAKHYMEIPGAGAAGTYSLNGIGNSTNETGPTWFEYTIYDSTEGSTAWNTTSLNAANRLSAKFRVALNLKYQDTTRPVVKIRPFYWNSLTENSVYTSKALADISSVADLEGHIELEGDLPSSFTADGSDVNDRDPKVSGVIKIEGYAYDDIKLSQLWVQMSGHTNLANRTTAVSTYTTSGIWPETTYSATTGWGFKAEDIYCNGDGHLVKWTLTVDTAKRTTVAQADQTVVVYAVDARGAAATNTSIHDESTQTSLTTYLWGNVKEETNAASTYYTDFWCNTPVNSSTADTTVVYKEADLTSMTYYYQMDIVPYITSITTSLSSLKRTNPSVYNRTARGHYPVRIGETITFNGYNLGSETTLPIPDTLTSSEYQFEVEGIQAINNLNDNNSKGNYTKTVNLTQKPAGDKTVYNNYYNRQPNGDNNNLLTDDIWLDVWEFKSDAAVPISGKIEQPVMKINPVTGQLGFAFVNGPLYFSMGGASDHGETSYDYWMGSFDFFTSVGFTYDSLGYSYGVAAGGDINASAADKFQLMTSRWGHAGRGQNGSYSSSNSLRLESIGQKTASGTRDYDKQRIKSPSLATAVHGTDTNLYLAYYDAMNDEIRFKAGPSSTFNQVASTTIVETDTYVQIASFDNTGNRFAHIPGNSLSNGKIVRIYDAEQNLADEKYYKVAGWGGNEGNYWFRLEEVTYIHTDAGCGTLKTDSTELNYYPAVGSTTDATVGEGTYVRVCSDTPVCTIGASNFVDYDVINDSYRYRHETVSMLAGSNTGRNAGQYVSIGVVPGDTATTDKVVAVWYDQTERVLRYAYNTTPLEDRHGQTDGSGWTYVANPVFSDDMENAGEYCQLAVDANGGIHIAAYDPTNCDLVYAYLSSYDATPQTCVVDASGVVGSNITIDVAMNQAGDNGIAIPRIGYYATSCIRPKVATLYDTTSTHPNGAVDDVFTGKWECSVVPTSSTVNMQSNQYNKINVAVWKTAAGVLTNCLDSDTFSQTNTTADNTKTNTPNVYQSVSYGSAYGNGTSNAIMGYAIKVDSSNDAIETAQMK